LASRMAAEITSKFGVTPKLKEGHGGIFEVTVDDLVIYTNGGQCGCLPDNEEVLQRIGKYRASGVKGYEALPSKGVGT
jgi:predicted Rdx family selenoprotein